MGWHLLQFTSDSPAVVHVCSLKMHCDSSVGVKLLIIRSTIDDVLISLFMQFHVINNLHNIALSISFGISEVDYWSVLFEVELLSLKIASVFIHEGNEFILLKKQSECILQTHTYM